MKTMVHRHSLKPPTQQTSNLRNNNDGSHHSSPIFSTVAKFGAKFCVSLPV